MKITNLILIIPFFLLSCGNNDTKIEGQQNIEEAPQNIVKLTPEQFSNAGIEIAKLSYKNISSLLQLNGKIDVPPQSMVSVSVPLGGYLKSSNLLPGTHVKKGEILAVMEDAQYIQLQQDYLTAKALFTLTESEYKRQGELNKSKATSDKMYEQAKANYQKQLVAIKALEEKLKLIGLNPTKLSPETISKNTNIYSPISGFVTAVNVNIGKYVTPSDILFELVDPSDIHLTLSVFEKDINKLSIGQKLFAHTNVKPDKKYACEIILISKQLSLQSATEVHCHFEEYDSSLLPGMFMNAEVELSDNKVSALPDEAVVRFESKQYVFVAEGNNQFKMLEVATGHSENGYTEVNLPKEYLSRNFVTKGAYNLLMALKNTEEE